MVSQTLEIATERPNKKESYQGWKWDKSPEFRGTGRIWKDEDRDDYIEPRRRRRVRAKVTLPDRKNTGQKFGGTGGHMTSALLQQMSWYDEIIKAARIWCKEAVSKKDAELAHQRLDILLRGRGQYMGKRRERLLDRGYKGPFPRVA